MVYAGFWRRYLAVLIDGIILLIPNLAFNFVVPYVGAFLMGFLYYPIFNSSPLQATPGKAIMGLAVVDENGSTLTLKTAIIRHAATFLSALFLCIGYLMNLFTAKRQTFHDMVAQSVVIFKQHSDVNYFHIWLNEVKRLGGDSKISNELDNNFQNSTAAGVAAKAIEELHKLFQSGAITQEEYDFKKAELLKKI